jgi:hypothetical protein
MSEDPKPEKKRTLPDALKKNVYQPGKSGNPLGRPPGIKSVASTFTSGGHYYTTVIFLENLPLDLSTLTIAQARLWKSSDTATNPSGPGSGFPYVPQPLTGIA